MKDVKRTVVIGSGFGGLAAAIRLQALGFSTTILEKNDQVGGRAGRIREKGYVFDAGPSLITAPSVIDSLYRSGGTSLEAELRLVPLDSYYRVHFHDGTWIDYSGDANAMKEQMRRFDPRDAEAYDRFQADADPVRRAVMSDALGGAPLDTWGKMLAFVPQALRLKAFLPLHFHVSRYFRNFRHRFLFSFHPLFIGGDPFRSPSIYRMISSLEKVEGVWFAPGGMHALVESFADLFRRNGGRILLGAEVERIVVEDGRATAVVAGGVEHPADLVVSNADVGHTYRDLVDASHRPTWTDRKVAKMDQSMSCFLLYLGVKRRYDKLHHHTLILSERYRELVRDIFQRKILPDDFSLYLHTPTRTDPSLAPEGCESIYVLSPVANNRSGIDWEREKDRYARRILEFLESWGLEGLRDNLEVCRVVTPDHFQKNLNSLDGNAFGVSPGLLQTGVLRPHNRSEDVSNLYFVGAGTHPGAGVPGVLLSAQALEKCVREDFPQVA
ncbi:MAG TPA: phytoene desaturase family protein [Fibrobacteria bacterium]|nr:phytoene desaturase family protein [Fibrobacteria bacterium]